MLLTIQNKIVSKRKKKMTQTIERLPASLAETTAPPDVPELQAQVAVNQATAGEIPTATPLTEPMASEPFEHSQPEIRAITGKDNQLRFSVHGTGVDGKRTSRFMSRDEVNAAFEGFKKPEQQSEITIAGHDDRLSFSEESTEPAATSTGNSQPEAPTQDNYAPKDMRKDTKGENDTRKNTAAINALPELFGDQETAGTEDIKKAMDADEAFDTLPDFVKEQVVVETPKQPLPTFEIAPEDEADLKRLDEEIANQPMDELPDGTTLDEVIDRMTPEKMPEPQAVESWFKQAKGRFGKFGRRVLALLGSKPVPEDEIRKDSPAYQAIQRVNQIKAERAEAASQPNVAGAEAQAAQQRQADDEQSDRAA